MKARLLPVFLSRERTVEFDEQLDILRGLLAEVAEILEPIELGSAVGNVDAVLLPQLIGEAYRKVEEVKKIEQPILILTSEFGTVAMWDWEIITYFKSKGIDVFTPYTLEQSKIICRAFALKKEMRNGKFIVFQDSPGEGMQAEIFKRFFWWEDECSKSIYDRFGIAIEQRSFKKLAGDAKNISDQEARKIIENMDMSGIYVSGRPLLSAVKMYRVLEEVVDNDPSIKGVGINCLNESFYSDTTPCLAFCMLFEEKGVLWACEADTMSLLTQYIVYTSIQTPVFMSNLYPFLMGMTAIKHEKISEFPQVREPENHVLVAHCGYTGLMPSSFADEWRLKERVLEIVDENATAVDARIKAGPVTITKLHPGLERVQLIEAVLEDYVQYPGSDCRNGALLKVEDGKKLMKNLYSHHSCIISGDKSAEMELVAKILELDIKKI